MRKLHFFNLQISGKVYLKMVITSFFNLYEIHVFPKSGECGPLNFELQMGVAGLIFEPQPLNFAKLHTF